MTAAVACVSLYLAVQESRQDDAEKLAILQRGLESQIALVNAHHSENTAALSDMVDDMKAWVAAAQVKMVEARVAPPTLDEIREQREEMASVGQDGSVQHQGRADRRRQ